MYASLYMATRFAGIDFQCEENRSFQIYQYCFSLSIKILPITYRHVNMKDMGTYYKRRCNDEHDEG